MESTRNMLSQNLQSKFQGIIQENISKKITPGVVVGIIDGTHRTMLAAGNFTYDTSSPRVTTDTTYDAASLTKSVACGLLALKAIEEKIISLDTKLTDHVPEFVGKYHDRITVRHLLTYTVISDLANSTAELSVYGGHELVHTLQTAPLKSPPGTDFAYINTPIIMLILLLEKVYKEKFYPLVERKIFKPLLMTNTTFYPQNLKDSLVPPTESVKGELVHKIVHDESARAMQADGYQTGHAGMFSTANDLLNVCEMILNKGTFQETSFLQPQTINYMLTNQLEDIEHRNGLGWEMDESFFRGLYVDPDIIGKTGFTGCSITINHAKNKAMVFLSNATYPDRSTTREQIIKMRLKLLKVCEII